MKKCAKHRSYKCGMIAKPNKRYKSLIFYWHFFQHLFSFNDILFHEFHSHHCGARIPIETCSAVRVVIWFIYHLQHMKSQIIRNWSYFDKCGCCGITNQSLYYKIFILVPLPKKDPNKGVNENICVLKDTDSLLFNLQEGSC